jgi:hypothetical protein
MFTIKKRLPKLLQQRKLRMEVIVSDPADPKHCVADSDYSFHFDADPDATVHFDADPDPSPHQSAANLRPLVYRSSTTQF